MADTIDLLKNSSFESKLDSLISAVTENRTPVKGVDYFTPADKAELVQDVLAALPEWTGGSY